jgi:plasmid stability protein
MSLKAWMSTLYVENVPDDLYESLRLRAQERRTSISAEVLKLLAENVPTRAELARRKEFVSRVTKLRARAANISGAFPTAEEMQREDRNG